MRAQRSEQRQVAREISYSHSAETKGGRALVRAMENATGRLRLIKRAKGYEQEVAAGRDFWEVMVDRYGLTLDVLRGSLDNIPTEGPLILIANHPYGILDGLMLGHMLSERRGDFRILANSVFTKARDVEKHVAPISFEDSKEAQRDNARSIRNATRYVKQGGALGIFPSGTVSTSKSAFSPAHEPLWPPTAAMLIRASGATVVPIFFHGSNKRGFQIASNLHGSLRLGLFVNEFRKRTDTSVEVSIGEPLYPDALREMSEAPGAFSKKLRAVVLSLGGRDPEFIGRQYLRYEDD